MISTVRCAPRSSISGDDADKLQARNVKATMTPKEKHSALRERQSSPFEAHVEELKAGTDKHRREEMERKKSVPSKDTDLRTHSLASKQSDFKSQRVLLKEHDKDRWSKMDKKELEAELDRLEDNYEDQIMKSSAAITRLEAVVVACKGGCTVPPTIVISQIKKNAKEVPLTVHVPVDYTTAMSFVDNASEESKSTASSAAVSESEALHGSTGHSSKHQNEIKVLMENNANLRQLVEELTAEKMSPKSETDIQQSEFMQQTRYKIQQLEKESNDQVDPARRGPSEANTADDEFDVQKGSVTELWRSLRILQKSEKSARVQMESAFKMMLNLDNELRAKVLSLKAMRELKQQRDRDLQISQQQVSILTRKQLVLEEIVRLTSVECHKGPNTYPPFKHAKEELQGPENLPFSLPKKESAVTDNQSVISEVHVPVPVIQDTTPPPISTEATPTKRLSISKIVPPRVLGTKVTPTPSPSEKALPTRIPITKPPPIRTPSEKSLLTKVPVVKSPQSIASSPKAGPIKRTLSRPQSDITIRGSTDVSPSPSPQNSQNLKALQEKLDKANNALKASDEARSKLASDLMNADARTSMIEKSYKNLEDMLHDANDKSAESQRGFNSIKDQLLFSKQNAEGLRGQLTGSKLSAEELKEKLAISQQCSTLLMEELLVGQRNAGIMKSEQDNTQKSPEILRGELIISQQTVTALRWDLNVRQKSAEAQKSDLLTAQASLATKTKELSDTEEMLAKAREDLITAVSCFLIVFRMNCCLHETRFFFCIDFSNM